MTESPLVSLFKSHLQAESEGVFTLFLMTINVVRLNVRMMSKTLDYDLGLRMSSGSRWTPEKQRSCFHANVPSSKE